MAFAFTGPGARRPFEGTPWPAPGDWAAGVRASRVHHLPVWIAAELWQVELDGSVRDVGTQLRADRGRLVRRVDAWDSEAARAFAASCAARIVEVAGGTARGSGPEMEAYRADADAFSGPGDANVAGWIAARAAASAAGAELGAEQERERQAAWLADRLGLADARV